MEIQILTYNSIEYLHQELLLPQPQELAPGKNPIVVGIRHSNPPPSVWIWL